MHNITCLIYMYIYISKQIGFGAFVNFELGTQTEWWVGYTIVAAATIHPAPPAGGRRPLGRPNL